ncbi:hypothetical protein [Cytobacillus gottheilii]|uniref:DNA-binding protein n=1 Tax=Cytobacillus gottheilii TaxID=859144 RepID=A0ABX8FAC1_9BACI|nr:hypothetical protein [Cytobacillus gottheilii]QVY60969.1 hypothetical protein J1899_18660 [Cytobacillus gottheilii]
MPSINIPLSEMANEVVVDHIKLLCQQAYEQGVEDARKKFSFPEVLTKEHLVEIFQVEKSTVNKIVAIPTFPKLKDVRARYPREQVFSWITNNSTWVDKNTNYFSKEAM